MLSYVFVTVYFVHCRCFYNKNSKLYTICSVVTYSTRRSGMQAVTYIHAKIITISYCGTQLDMTITNNITSNNSFQNTKCIHLLKLL